MLALADVLRPNATAQPFTTEAEQEIWEIFGELKACYERDRGQIQTAHNIQASQEADDVGYVVEGVRRAPQEREQPLPGGRVLDAH